MGAGKRRPAGAVDDSDRISSAASRRSMGRGWDAGGSAWGALGPGLGSAVAPGRRVLRSAV